VYNHRYENRRCRDCASAAVLGAGAGPARVAVLGQIARAAQLLLSRAVPAATHQRPSSVAWTRDGRHVIYSMQGSLWSQPADGARRASQLTDDAGADYQPDCSPDGRASSFVRYDGRRWS
jgi:hypothetical protein